MPFCWFLVFFERHCFFLFTSYFLCYFLDFSRAFLCANYFSFFLSGSVVLCFSYFTYNFCFWMDDFLTSYSSKDFLRLCVLQFIGKISFINFKNRLRKVSYTLFEFFFENLHAVNGEEIVIAWKPPCLPS